MESVWRRGLKPACRRNLRKLSLAVVNGRSLGISELAVPTDRREGWMEADCLVSGWLEERRRPERQLEPRKRGEGS